MSNAPFALFLNREGAMGFGHVGWAFGVRPGYSCIGSIENYGGTPYTSPEDKNMWVTITRDRDVSGIFYDRDYDYFKELRARHVNVNSALACVRYWEALPYEIFGKNCMDSVYDIFRAYGIIGLPKPSDIQNWAPNNWFNHFPGSAKPVLPHHQIRSTKQSPDEISDLFKQINASCPKWRDEKTLALIE